jgi:hypothetical protein
MENNTNHDLVTKGFNRLLKALSPYIIRELVRTYGTDFWREGVIGKLYDDQRRGLPTSGKVDELTSSLDIAKCLLLIEINWREVFGKRLPRDCKNYVIELKGKRNEWAHKGIEDVTDSNAFRALDTMSRLAEQVDPEAAGDINALLRQVRYGSAEGSTAVISNAGGGAEAAPARRKSLEQTKAVRGLPSWREVMEPHMDVAEGRYKNAEFAADLAQVARGKGELEYRDPVEFFNRTYVTEGMKGLLVQSLRRVSELDGEPVIQLKTAFGGGKTHSMLALYHMMRSRSRVGQIANLAPVLEAAGVSEVPEVHVAVLVGTALNPANSKRPPTMPGITVNTLWGEMAFQLAESAGKPELYDYVKEADKRGVSPGSEALANLFDACGCCLVLMDELVAYAKKLYGADKLPAGTLDNFITFIQELTEAARASKCSLVVASIPESDNEIGGEAGQRALEQIEHTFGRMESIWKPVGASEGFEVVRRRLFLNCKDEAARDEVCFAFSEMYGENTAEFPTESRELEYRERMVSCYPIHPEVFDRLYEDWATLERFQRTRGVLRLMAAVIHELWMSRDPSPMIMPGSFPLDVPGVRDELTRYLDDNWNAVVDSEVDGKQSLPYRNDRNNPRYGSLLASRRVARTVMLGSAPDVGGQSVRGIERAHIRLGTVQPGENISVFNDALGTLQTSSSYLYSDANGNRFWYDTRPTLRKVAEDRAQMVKDSDALFEVESRLKRLRKVEPFSGIHVCPASTLDVPDDQSLRLVVLPPAAKHRSGAAESEALKLASEIITSRGSTPRSYKNMIVFAAADASCYSQILKSAKQYLAWDSIKADRESLNLDVAQTRETEQSARRADESLDAKIQEAYSWLLYPRIDLFSGSMDIEWEVEHVAGGGESIVAKMARKLLSNDAAIQNWAPALLKMELDRILWKESDHIQVKQLWEYLCQYCYLPRLSGYSVLENTILRGLGSKEFFGIAAAFSGGQYVDLSLGEQKAFINASDLLVKAEVAETQIDRYIEETHAVAHKASARSGAQGHGGDDVKFVTTAIETWRNGDDSTSEVSAVDATVVPNRQKRDFRMVSKLDNTRVNRGIQSIMEEVVSQLNLIGADVELTFEVHARVADGIPPETVRALSENCSTLGVSDFRFSE